MAYKAFNLLDQEKYDSILRLNEEDLKETVKRKKTLPRQSVQLPSNASILDAVYKVFAKKEKLNNEEIDFLEKLEKKVDTKLDHASTFLSAKNEEIKKRTAESLSRYESIKNINQLIDIAKYRKDLSFDHFKYYFFDIRKNALTAHIFEELEIFFKNVSKDIKEKLVIEIRKYFLENKTSLSDLLTQAIKFNKVNNLFEIGLIDEEFINKEACKFAVLITPLEKLNIDKLDSNSYQVVVSRALKEENDDWLSKNLKRDSINNDQLKTIFEEGFIKTLDKILASRLDLMYLVGIKISTTDGYIKSLKFIKNKFSDKSAKIFFYNSLEKSAFKDLNHAKKFFSILDKNLDVIKEEAIDFSFSMSGKIRETEEIEKLAVEYGALPYSREDIELPLEYFRKEEFLKSIATSLSSTQSAAEYTLLKGSLDEILERLEKAELDLNTRLNNYAPFFHKLFSHKKIKTVEDIKKIENKVNFKEYKKNLASSVIYSTEEVIKYLVENNKVDLQDLYFFAIKKGVSLSILKEIGEIKDETYVEAITSLVSSTLTSTEHICNLIDETLETLGYRECLKNVLRTISSSYSIKATEFYFLDRSIDHTDEIDLKYTELRDLLEKNLKVDKMKNLSFLYKISQKFEEARRDTKFQAKFLSEVFEALDWIAENKLDSFISNKYLFLASQFMLNKKLNSNNLSTHLLSSSRKEYFKNKHRDSYEFLKAAYEFCFFKETDLARKFLNKKLNRKKRRI